MKNLAGIQTPISNTVIRVELAKAGIAAFDGEASRSREVPATVIGIMAFVGGTEVLFVRAWYYWTVHLSRALPFEQAQELNSQWSEVVRVDGYAGGTEPSRHGVTSYHVDAQEGLNVLVETLKSTFGVQCVADPHNLVHTLDSMVPGSLKPLSAPNGTLELARTEIAGLLALGGVYNRYDATEFFYEEALNVATAAFGSESHETNSLRAVLSNLYRDEVRRQKRLLEQLSSDHDEYCATADLERVLSKRVEVLQSLNRYKEARSVARACSRIRPMLAEIYRTRKQRFSDELAEQQSGETRSGQVEYTRFQIVFTTMRLAQVLHRMGATDEANKIETEGNELAKTLSDSYQRELEKVLTAA